MFRRIFFFLLVNAGVLLTISAVTSIFGLHNYLTPYGLNYESLIIFALVWGFGGAFISLLISKWMAKRAMGVRVIDPTQAAGDERRVYEMVASLASRAGLPMPEVGIYDSPEINAFATGPSKKNSLVAVSSGLLHAADDASLEAILGHEIAHIRNGDMVTMTLIQGVINAFVIIFARIIALVITQFLSRGEEESSAGGFAYYAIVFVLEIALTALGSLVVFYFSRAREYRADAGGALYTSQPKMIGALEFLQKNFLPQAETASGAKAESIQAFKISGTPSRFAELFSTHPPLEKRIAMLKHG